MNKIVSTMAEAIADVPDGATVMIGGFGAVGQPTALIDGLLEQGATDLTLVANNAGWDREVGIPRLIAAGRVRKMICSYPRGSAVLEEEFRAGRIELEVVPQGTLAERIRAGGAGIPAFFTATGVGTLMAEGKEVRRFGERDYLMELGLRADLALVECWRADPWGNLVYRSSGRNFNPIMAMAAALTVAQSQHLAALGDLPPETIVTPGIFVSRVIHVPCGDPPSTVVAPRFASTGGNSREAQR